MVQELADLGVNRSSIAEWQASLQKIIERSKESSGEGGSGSKGPNGSQGEASSSERFLSQAHQMVLDSLLRVMRQVVIDGNKESVDAYRMALIEERLQTSGAHGPTTRNSRLAFWCLSPSLVFRPMISDVRSVVLTSGTLSPMDVMASELSVSFPHRLESLHIIDSHQICVAAVAKAPNGAPLLGVYKNMEMQEYQDGIAQAVLEIARTVPNGVLCFLPSYGFMNKLLKRMKASGVEADLARIKQIFIGTTPISLNTVYVCPCRTSRGRQWSL